MAAGCSGRWVGMRWVVLALARDVHPGLCASSRAVQWLQQQLALWHVGGLLRWVPHPTFWPSFTFTSVVVSLFHTPPQEALAQLFPTLLGIARQLVGIGSGGAPPAGADLLAALLAHFQRPARQQVRYVALQQAQVQSLLCMLRGVGMRMGCAGRLLCSRCNDPSSCSWVASLTLDGLPLLQDVLRMLRSHLASGSPNEVAAVLGALTRMSKGSPNALLQHATPLATSLLECTASCNTAQLREVGGWQAVQHGGSVV